MAVSNLSMVNILSCFQFVYMAKGRETMVNENTREEVTASDGLQLGHTSAEPTDMQSTEEEILQLKKKVAEVSESCLHWSECLCNWLLQLQENYLYI